MAVVAVVLGLDEMLFALAPQGGRPTEATCAFAGALVNVLGVNVLGFGVWTLIYAARAALGRARARTGARCSNPDCAQDGAPSMALRTRSRPMALLSRSRPPSSCCSLRKLRAARRLPHARLLEDDAQ